MRDADPDDPVGSRIGSELVPTAPSGRHVHTAANGRSSHSVIGRKMLPTDAVA
jgi:hypothetical protein